jgi:hypothetical protein
LPVSPMRSTLTDVIDASEVIVIGKKDEDFRNLADSPPNGHVFIDLVRLFHADVDLKDYGRICLVAKLAMKRRMKCCCHRLRDEHRRRSSWLPVSGAFPGRRTLMD